MDWKIFTATFVTIFLAEFGDKTQFAAMAASAGTSSRMSVLLAVVLALSLAGVLGVVAGGLVGQFLDPRITRWVAGILFIGVGVWMLAFS